MAKMRISPELKKLIEKYRCVKDTKECLLLRYISWWEKMKTYI